MRFASSDLVSRFLKGRGVWTYPAWILIGLGTTGLIGAVAGIDLLTQPFVSRPPVRPVAAVCLLSLGIAAMALRYERRRLALVAAIPPVVLSYLSLLQLAGFDLGFLSTESIPDQLFGSGLLSREILPLAAGVGFLLSGMAVLLCVTRFRHENTGAFALGLTGSVLVALNLAILLGQVFGLSPEVQFGRLAGASPQTALGLFVMGLALNSLAWNQVWAPRMYPAWVPPGVGLASLVAVLFVWRTLVLTQRDDHAALLRSVARAAGDRLQESMGRLNLALWRVTAMSKPPVIGTTEWTDFVRNVVRDEVGLTHVAWVPRQGRIRLVPATPDSILLRAQLALQFAPLWRAGVTVGDSVRHFSLADSAGSIATAIPECDLAQCHGFVVGLLRVDQMMHGLFADSLDGFHRTVTWRGRPLMGTRARPPEGGDFLDRSLVSFEDMTWELLVWPTPELQKRIQTGLPNLLLAFGLVMSALLALALQLGRTLQSNSRSVEEVRLQLALGRSMDRAWSWDLTVNDRPPGIRESGTGQEIREGDWTELVHPDDRQRVLALLRAHLQALTPAFEAQYRVQKEGGEWGWSVDRGHVSERGPDGAPRKMLGVSGDVTERHRIDQERESSERRFRAIFDSAHHFQVLLDREGRVLEANSAALKRFGTDASLESIAGKPFAEAWWKPGDPTRERISTATEKARSGMLVTLEAEVEPAGGDGRLTYDLSLKPIRDHAGAVIQLLAEGRDITWARRAEAQLREVETLSTMGRLAARVAHEINNPLAGIQNSFLLLRDAIPGSHPHYAYVGAMEREIRRIASVTRQLYETYRPEADGGGSAGVRTLIGDAVALLSQVNRPSQVTIRSELERLPAEVPIPESVLRQSVYNLVQNAVEASPPGGTVTVRAETNNGTFELRVRDQGPGIPESIRPVLFQPFVSTKGRSSGTSGMGIGLSLVHRSVQAVGGSIEIIDPPEGGTEFVVRMPITGKDRNEPSE